MRSGDSAGFPVVALSLVALGGAAFALYATISARGDFVGNLSDSAVYLVAAELLSPWTEPSHPAGMSVVLDYPFPPLYPLILGFLGGGGLDSAASYRADAVLDALMVALAGGVAWRITASVWMAVLSTGVLWLLPGMLIHALGLYSESLYAALSFAALTLSLANEPSRRTELGTAALAGIAVLARTAGISLVLALLAQRLLERRRPSLAWWMLLLGPACTWQLIRYALDANTGYSASLVRGSAGETLVFLSEVVAANAATAGNALARLIDYQATPAAMLALVIVLTFALPVWLSRLWQKRADALYLLFYISVIGVWPYPEHLARFLLPVAPLLLVYAVSGGRELAVVTRMRRAGSLLVLTPLLVVVAAALPASLRILDNTVTSTNDAGAALRRSPQWYQYADENTAATTLARVEMLVEDMRAIDEHLPHDACVSSAAAPYVLLYGRRRTQRLVPANTNDAAFYAQLERCPYIFMLAAEQWPSHGYPAMYPYKRVRHEMDVIAVRLWNPGATSGTARSMLVRYAHAASGERRTRKNAKNPG